MKIYLNIISIGTYRANSLIQLMPLLFRKKSILYIYMRMYVCLCVCVCKRTRVEANNNLLTILAISIAIVVWFVGVVRGCWCCSLQCFGCCCFIYIIWINSIIARKEWAQRNYMGCVCVCANNEFTMAIVFALSLQLCLVKHEKLFGLNFWEKNICFFFLALILSF